MIRRKNTESFAGESTREGSAVSAVPLLTVHDLFREFLRRKLLIFAAVLCGMVVGAFLTWVLNPVYEAKVVVSPITQEGIGNAFSGLRSQLGGLAAIAGVDLGSLASENKIAALATLESEEFAREFIEANGLLDVLYADKWDVRPARWKRPDNVPTVNHAVRFFCKKVRFVVEDRRTGLVTMRIEWRDPDLAARWANQMIDMVNERLRLEAIRQAEESIEILGKEIRRTDSIELRELLYRLMQSNINAKTVAVVRRDYAFRVIDRAFAPDPDQMKRPRLVPMIILGGVLGLLLAAGGTLFALVLREGRASAP